MAVCSSNILQTYCMCVWKQAVTFPALCHTASLCLFSPCVTYALFNSLFLASHTCLSSLVYPATHTHAYAHTHTHTLARARTNTPNPLVVVSTAAVYAFLHLLPDTNCGTSWKTLNPCRRVLHEPNPVNTLFSSTPLCGSNVSSREFRTVRTIVPVSLSSRPYVYETSSKSQQAIVPAGLISKPLAQ